MQANAAKCAPVSPDNADPPTNAVPFASWTASGARRWDCDGVNGTLTNPAQVDGQGNFTSFDGVWKGGFSYYDGVGKFDIQNTKDGGKYSYKLDDKPGLTPADSSLPNARWTVNWISAPPPGLNAGEQYQVRVYSNRTDTVPTACPSKEAKTVEIPFMNTYVLYNFVDENAINAPSSSAVRSLSSIGVITTAAVAVASTAAAALF